MHRLGHVGRTEIDYDFSWRGRACHSEALVVQNFRDFFLNRFAFESEVDEAGASDVRLLANFCNVEAADDRVRYFAWIFTALFPENERSVALVIAKARISRGRHVASRPKAGRCKRLGKFSRELRLKYFHRVLIVAASLCEARRGGGRRVACSVADGTSVSLAPTAFPHRAWLVAPAIFANTYLVGRDSVEPLSLSQLKLSSVKCFSAFQALEFGDSLGSEFWILGFLEADL